MSVDLFGCRALVTGGAGTIGSAIVDRLIQAGAAEVIVFDNFDRGRWANLRPALDHPQVEVVTGDIRDRASLRQAMQGVDLVFHQAAIRITQCAEEPALAHDVLATGSFNVLEAAVSAGVSRVVAASSASVYGQADVLPTDEDHHPWGNRTLYGAAKVYLEGLLRSFHETNGLDYVALRYFNVYGPRMDTHGVYTEVLVRWMERIHDGKPPLIFGDGDQSMDFVCVDDVAEANICAARSDVSDEVFNVATGVATSLDQLARTLLAVMGSNLTVERGPARLAANVRHRRADVEKASRLLGFRAQVDLAEGLRRLVDWWRVEQGRAA